MKLLGSFVLVAVSAAAVPAQSRHVVPSLWADAEAPSVSSVPGVGIDGHVQIVVDAVHLQPLVGRQIVGLTFRRDTTWPDALGSASAQITVRIGHAAHGASAAQPDLAANLPASLQVFQGAVAVPAAPSVTGYAGWAAPHTVTVSFQTAFTYTGGPLGVEVDGTSVGGPVWWPVDGVEDAVAGTVQEEGNACGSRASTLVRTALVPERALVVGGTVPFTFLGEPGSVAQMLLGFDTLPAPFDLAAIGAPGCELRVVSLASLPALVQDFGPAAGGGIAQVSVHLPADPGLFAAEFAVQWVEVGSALATSNTLRCRLASAQSSLGIATVSRAVDGSVLVHSTQAPVVGLLWQ